MPLVYDELHRLAQRYLRNERSDHTLQSTALVHEAYLRMVDQKTVRWQNRAHFFGVAAQSIRHILVDHARGHKAAKRGAGAAKLSLDEAIGLGRVEPVANGLVLEQSRRVAPREPMVFGKDVAGLDPYSAE